MADDADDEETFVVVGTPLPAYEDDEVPKKVTPYREQSVQDARGRPQRLHGAFTGGFSAGYFNTVGSKEGWQPATFRSSRSDRGDYEHQKPEDFMDEEDLGDHGITPRQISTTQDFTSENKQRESRKRHLPGGSAGIIPNDDLIRDIIIPTSVPMGIQLLRKMGWKEGQGVGPKVKKKSKKKPQPGGNAGPKIYGCALPTEGAISEESEDEIASTFTFAPKDTTPINFDAKDDLHGLGYSGITAWSMLGSTSSSLFQEPLTVSKTGKKGIKGHAFGIGILEDDDEDIYSTDSKANYMRELGAPEQDDLHGWTAPQHKSLNVGKKAIGSVGALLEGFKLSSQPLRVQKVYHPPQIPREFRPIHQPIPTQDGPLSVHIPRKSWQKKVMDASVRAVVRGEDPDIGSVFDLMSKKDKEKLTATEQILPASSTQHEPAAPDPQVDSVCRSHNESVNNLTQSIEEQTTPAVPLSEGTRFKPFAKNPEKQARYEKYLEITKYGSKCESKDIPSGNLTEWERNCEREEFARAAQLYRPMSSLMAARFTQAKYDDDTDGVEVTVEGQGDLNDKQKAVEMKMFGKLTRDHFEWHPDKLLCKRFNIPNPYPESSLVGVPKVKRDKFSVFNFLTIPEQDQPASPPKESTTKAPETPKAIKYKEESLNTAKPIHLFADVENMQSKPLIGVEMVSENTTDKTADATTTSKENFPENEQDVDRSDDADEKRPPMDLFQAIFDNNDSDMSSSDSELEEKKEPPELSSPDVAMEIVHGNEKVTKEDIDKIQEDSRADSLPRNQFERGSIETESVEKRLCPEVAEGKDSQYYGPVLPPSIHTSESTVTPHVMPSTVERTDRNKKKKHKEKKRHKHKEKHKKTKHKKRKKKHKHHHKSSSDGSASSNSDSELPSNLHLLQRLRSLPNK